MLILALTSILTLALAASARPSASRISSSGKPHSSTSAAEAAPRLSGLFKGYTDIPAMQSVRVNSNYAVAVRYFVEVRQVRHIPAVLIQTVKKDYNRIVLLRVVPLGSVHHECPGDVANSHCFLWILRTD